jgi:hypothetical protein
MGKDQKLSEFLNLWGEEIEARHLAKPEERSDEANDSLLAEVSSVDEAKEYLKSVCMCSFKDKTFETYIENTLAGDFAVEIANVIIRGSIK